MADWDNRFIEVSHLVSSWSKDRKRKVGAVIVDDRRIISSGFNGIPVGCNDDEDSRHLKPKKLLFFEHAERNAIYAAAKYGIKTEGCKMYLTWFPCADCARAIIQSGIKKVVCYEPDWKDDTWGDTFTASKEMMEEAGIEINLIGKV